METLWQDLRFALRSIRKNPGFTAVVVLSIGLAVGVNTTVFTWMDSLILNPYPVIRDADQLLALNTANTDGAGSGEPPISYPAYIDWRDSAKSFDGMVVYSPVRVNMRVEGEEQGEPSWGQFVSGNYFDVLRVPAESGRTFLPDEERSAAPVTVLSYNLWKRRFGGDEAIIGRHLLLTGFPVTVIGVAPPRFAGTIVGLGFDFWAPVTLQPPVSEGGNRLNSREDRWLQGFARLKPGISAEEARGEMMALATRISAANGETPVRGASVKRMREQFLGSLLFPLFSALLVVTGLVLLTACANVANLLLARSAARQREIAIRLALGAKRGRILRQLLTESLVLSLIGGGAGLLLALWGRDVLLVFIPPVPQPVSVAIDMNAGVIGFAMAMTFLTAGLFGLAPALRTSRPNLVPVLKDGDRGSRGGSKLKSALVVAQVALSLVSLTCAGLFLRSLQRARSMDLGFRDPDQVLLATTDLRLAGLNDDAGVVVVDRLLERVRALPGVKAAGCSTMVPLGFGGHSFSSGRVEGYTPQTDEMPSAERVIVSPDYFETMGIPLAAGRSITNQDTKESLRVAVVNEAFARRYWNGEDAVGKHLDLGAGWATVVGVVRDSKYQDLGETPYPVVYSPLTQRFASGLTLHIRTTGEPKELTEAVRSEFTSVNANLPFLDPRTLTEHISAASFVQFVGASMLSGFGALTLLLAAVGIYGVLSYAVNQRQREIAIRIALGANTRDVIRLVLREGVRLTAIGLLLGSVGSILAGRLLSSQLLGVSPSDPLTFSVVGLLLGVVAIVACLLPASRASRVDPVQVLKTE